MGNSEVAILALSKTLRETLEFLTGSLFTGVNIAAAVKL